MHATPCRALAGAVGRRQAARPLGAGGLPLPTSRPAPASAPGARSLLCATRSSQDHCRLAAQGPRRCADSSAAAAGADHRRALPCPPTPAGRRRLRVAAFAAQGATHPDGTYERVLRYPNGTERRIRYPLPPADNPRAEDLTDGCWGDSCWEPRAAWLGLAAPPGSSAGSSAGVGVGGMAARGAAAPAAPGSFLPQQPPSEVRRGSAGAVPALRTAAGFARANHACTCMHASCPPDALRSCCPLLCFA